MLFVIRTFETWNLGHSTHGLRPCILTLRTVCHGDKPGALRGIAEFWPKEGKLTFRRKTGSNFNLFLGKTVSFRQWAPKHKYKRPVNLPRGFSGILGSKVLWNVRACTRRKTHAHLSVEPQQRGNFLNMPRSSS